MAVLNVRLFFGDLDLLRRYNELPWPGNNAKAHGLRLLSLLQMQSVLEAGAASLGHVAYVAGGV